MTPVDRAGNRYFACYVDHLSTFARVFLAKNKHLAADQFDHFVAFLETNFGCKVQILRTDSGTEFRAMDLMCERRGIGRQKSEPYNQASNGKAERMIRTIMELARTMLLGSNLTVNFWGDAVLYACYVLNRTPTRANRGNLSPYEVLTKKVPYMADLVPFGAKCTVLVSHKYTKKEPWKPRALEGRILGKHEEVKGYRVFITSTKEVVTSQHVRNIEGLNARENQIIQQLLNNGRDARNASTHARTGGREPNTTDDHSSSEGEGGGTNCIQTA